MATMAFNKAFERNVKEWAYGETNLELCGIYMRAVEKGAMFDCRCFNIPKEEVTNLIYWRQLDASRNSIQMLGQANFSHKELQNKSCNDIQEMLMTQKGINWNDLPTYKKRGSCCVKTTQYKEGAFQPDDPVRTYWSIDDDITIFRGEDREYIDRLIYIEGE